MAFDHRAHLALAHASITQRGLHTALSTFPDRLASIAAEAGAPEKYHETLTLAWLLLIADRSARCGGFEQMLQRYPELLDPRLPERYYRAGTLSSDRARRTFVFPDGIEPI